MTHPKSFLEKATEGKISNLVKEHFWTDAHSKLQLHIHCLRQHKSVSAWVREAIREKMARELEADMHTKASEVEETPDLGRLSLCRK
jgi:hypothetical protein